MLYELEYNIFRKIIIKDLLFDFISYYEKQFIIKPSNIRQQLIDDRIGLMFGSQFCILKVDNEIGFDEARKVFVKKINESDTFSVSSTFHEAESLYYTMNELSLKKQLVKILKNKNEDIFLDNIQYKTKFNYNFLDSFDIDKPCIIDDNIDSPCNSEQNFEEVSYVMRARLADRKEKRTLSYNLDYKKCKKLFGDIIKDIKLEEAEDLLNDI